MNSCVVVLSSQYQLPYIRFRMRGLASYNDPSSGRCYKQAAPTSVHYNIMFSSYLQPGRRGFNPRRKRQRWRLCNLNRKRTGSSDYAGFEGDGYYYRHRRKLTRSPFRRSHYANDRHCFCYKSAEIRKFYWSIEKSTRFVAKICQWKTALVQVKF